MIELTPKGLYCSAGDFYIDPSRAVDHALITHAHSDHARKGSKHYTCVDVGRGLLARRIGERHRISTVKYGEPLRLGGVDVSFHPAGHMLGSAQIRISDGHQIWVVSGDYKRESDPSCHPFEIIPCDTFITEATFGNPKYKWGDTAAEIDELVEWWDENRKAGRNALLFCYAVGKTQRVLAELVRRFAPQSVPPVYLYGEAWDLTECYRKEGIPLPETRKIEDVAEGSRLSGELVIASSGIFQSPFLDRLGKFETAFASGWMQTGTFGSRSQYDRGFVISDHADFNALVQTARDTGAKRVLVHHGGEGALTRRLRDLGIDARALTADRPAALPVQGELFSAVSQPK